jgi:hypothetical protein
MDYPVIGSLARVAVSNRGEAARVLAKWRRFELARDLMSRSRDEIVQEIAERIWEAEGGVEVDVQIALGYGWTPAGFVPVARVGATDRAGVMEGGLLELVPIAAGTTAVGPEAPGPAAARLSLRVRFTSVTGRAVVEFALPAAQQAKVAVYGATGRLVRELADRRFPAGRHEIVWDGRDADSRPVASGTYFVRLDAEGGELAQKMVVVR